MKNVFATLFAVGPLCRRGPRSEKKVLPSRQDLRTFPVSLAVLIVALLAGCQAALPQQIEVHKPTANGRGDRTDDSWIPPLPQKTTLLNIGASAQAAAPAPPAVPPIEYHRSPASAASAEAAGAVNLAPPAEPLEFAEPLLAQAVEACRDIPPHWTGAVVYHAAWCRACPALLSDLRGCASSGWKVGAGNDVHFKLVDFDRRPWNVPQIDLLPTVVYFRDGKEESRIVGYSRTEEELRAILRKHPKCQKPTRSSVTAMGAQQAGACPCGPGCQCTPGNSCGCGGTMSRSSITSPMSYPGYSVTYALGDAYPLAVAPMYPPPMYAAPSVYFVPPYRSSATFGVAPAQSSIGLSVFGMPLVGLSAGTYVSGP